MISTDVCNIKEQKTMFTALYILSGKDTSYESADHSHSLKHMLVSPK